LQLVYSLFASTTKVFELTFKNTEFLIADPGLNIPNINQNQWVFLALSFTSTNYYLEARNTNGDSIGKTTEFSHSAFNQQEL
jgi:hypothetical protein